MACVPRHSFFKMIIDCLMQSGVPVSLGDKMMDVLCSTGPLLLTKLYDLYADKDGIVLLPPELVSPWTKWDTDLFWTEGGGYDEEALELKLSKAVAVHYFWGSW